MERKIKLPVSPAARDRLLEILPDFDKIAAFATALGADSILIKKTRRL